MKLCLLGASGSIGSQTLDIINKNKTDFELVSFSVGKQTRKINNIIKRHIEVKNICIQEEEKLLYYKKRYPHINFYCGDEGLIDLINNSHPDMVVNALVGFVGLKPTLFALENNYEVALANKESLVVGGELINELLNKGHGHIYPIDSEHNALWKCLLVDNKNVKMMHITASGGAFRKLSRDELNTVTPEMALNHPTWKMGNKITIDCATMVNKAFEIIEAHYLYNYPYSKISVTLHDESRVHSYIEYDNGLLRADISKPDMRNPIKFALYKGKIDFKTYTLSSLDELKDYHFHKFNLQRYPMIKYAKTVIENKGVYGAVFNASNEVAVHAFLKHKISFLEIENIIDACMAKAKQEKVVSYEQLLRIDRDTRKLASTFIKERRLK